MHPEGGSPWHAEPRRPALRALGRRFFAEQDRLRGGPRRSCARPATARGSAAIRRRSRRARGLRARLLRSLRLRHEVERSWSPPTAWWSASSCTGTTPAPFLRHAGEQALDHRPGHVILTVRDGQVTELMGVFDEAGMLRQLGALPAG